MPSDARDALVLRERLEGDEPPRDVIGAFVRQEVTDQVSAAFRNDARPVASVLRECLALERVDLVADDTRDLHAAVSQAVDRHDSSTMQRSTLDDPDDSAASIAAAIGEPARARMLYCLIDGRARTSTELAAVADVTPSTASVHLRRLQAERLVKVFAQGKHRYYSLERADVAAALEALSVLAGGPGRRAGCWTPPAALRAARTCYDHIAGTLGVGLHDRFVALRWFSHRASGDVTYDLTPTGIAGFAALGVDVEAARARRRRLAFACLDWSERTPHLGGALGSALLHLALKRAWVSRDLDSRTLTLTSRGRRDLRVGLGLDLPP